MAKKLNYSWVAWFELHLALSSFLFLFLFWFAISLNHSSDEIKITNLSLKHEFPWSSHIWKDLKNYFQVFSFTFGVFFNGISCFNINAAAGWGLFPLLEICFKTVESWLLQRLRVGGVDLVFAWWRPVKDGLPLPECLESDTSSLPNRLWPFGSQSRELLYCSVQN